MQYSFESVVALSAVLGQKIKLDGFEPQYIVGVARGGWVPARLLSNELEVKRLLSIGLEYMDVDRTHL